MLKFGIIGAENSHCTAVATACNVEKLIPARVVAVWGERMKSARAAAEAAQIPEIVKDWRGMLGKVDGVMIDHRHPKDHAEPAAFYLEHGVPTFVDKPFTWTLAEGRKLCQLARRKGVPLTSFSTIPLQKQFGVYKKAMEKVMPVAFLNSTGPAELKSKYGGIFFYGVHQVDAIVELLGTDVDSAFLMRHKKGGVGIITYRNGPVVTMNCMNTGNGRFHWSVVGRGPMLDWIHERDASQYLAGAKRFTAMFRTGREPLSHERILAPIAILEAMAKSLKLRRCVKVAKVRL